MRLQYKNQIVNVYDNFFKNRMKEPFLLKTKLQKDKPYYGSKENKTSKNNNSNNN